MQDLQKLKVILFERHQEPVLLFLGKMGVAQYIKVDCEEESDNGFLHACQIPTEESLMNSDIQTRIIRDFEEMHLKPDNKIHEEALLPGNTIKEVLSNIEQKLTEIEADSTPIIELLDLASTLIKKTGQQLQTWEASHKNLNSKYEPQAGQHSPKELLFEANGHLTDINNQLEETGREVLELQSLAFSGEHSIKENPELDDIQSNLTSLQGMTLKVDSLLEAEKNMAHCDAIIYFEAWILKKQFPKVEEGIKEITNGKCVIEQEKPNSQDNVPNVIKHHPRFFEGFESLLAPYQEKQGRYQ